jgi:hypothetical protein
VKLTTHPYPASTLRMRAALSYASLFEVMLRKRGNTSLLPSYLLTWTDYNKNTAIFRITALSKIIYNLYNG